MENELFPLTPILPSTLEREQSRTEGSGMETEQGLGKAGRETDRPQTHLCICHVSLQQSTN